MILPTRRAVLAMLLAGCAHRPTLLTPAPTGAPVRLGWRWVPGMRHTYRVTMQHTEARLSTTRVEVWRYTAVALDPAGIVSLRGRLTGFGAQVTVDGVPLPDDTIEPVRQLAQDETVAEVELSMSLTGRIVSCSAPSFDGALPHRLLGSRLPSNAVLAGESWSDPSLAVPFTGILPLDASLSAEMTTALRSVESATNGWTAELVHHGRLRTTTGGPVITLHGQTTWATDPGALVSRRLEARLQPDGDGPTPASGVLTVTLRSEGSTDS